MKKLLILGMLMALKMAHAIVINAGNENLYLGNHNVSCGRYTLTDRSRVNEVESFCNILGSSNDGRQFWLRVQTVENGAIDCSFVDGALNQCFVDN